MTDAAEKFKSAIDQKLEDDQEDGLRAHLGASVLGRECEREIWYSFRWAVKRTNSARMLRLFDRGHKEEFRFEEWIRSVSDEVWTTDPKTGNQIRISDFQGHFGGSLDGVVKNPIDIPGVFLLEFKTHNDKSYKKLLLSGVASAKPEHYVQIQIYLHYRPKLKGAFYFAINKNDDSLYVEYVERDERFAEKYVNLAQRVLISNEPLPMMDKAGPFNFYCKGFCDNYEVCQKNKAPHKTCRSCAYWRLADDGKTKCLFHDKFLTLSEQKTGCEKYERLF